MSPNIRYRASSNMAGLVNRYVTKKEYLSKRCVDITHIPNNNTLIILIMYIQVIDKSDRLIGDQDKIKSMYYL